MSWQLALAGLLIGVLVGATGMGGGSLMTPLLVLGFDFKPILAVGTDIAHGALFKTFGALRHRRLGTVQARLSGWMFIGSAPASLLGVTLATQLERAGAEPVMRQLLGVGLILGGVGLAAKAIIRFYEAADVAFVMTRRDRMAAVAIGIVGGFIVGLTSVGSGVFFALTLLVVFPLRSSKVVGTDIFHAAALLWVAGSGHMLAGNVDIRAVGWLLVGSVPGVLIGSQMSVRLPDRALRLVMAATLLATGLKVIDISHDPILIAIAVGVGGFVIAIAFAAKSARRNRRDARIAQLGRVP